MPRAHVLCDAICVAPTAPVPRCGGLTRNRVWTPRDLGHLAPPDLEAARARGSCHAQLNEQL